MHAVQSEDKIRTRGDLWTREGVGGHEHAFLSPPSLISYAHTLTANLQTLNKLSKHISLAAQGARTHLRYRGDNAEPKYGRDNGRVTQCAKGSPRDHKNKASASLVSTSHGAKFSRETALCPVPPLSGPRSHAVISASVPRRYGFSRTQKLSFFHSGATLLETVAMPLAEVRWLTDQ
ncbi:hypothetical protein SKAU_G00051420 [Synaphobranchus kaupii]|uniref:Uncharacterized protein n=1 Tax=Synaphobranchus kaupii TaxID=118154 RepID=A0A9Q1G445_SYNKA|nr:hypothetical protein SKAU_G00051420 [Synaphobranchus kaupii]